VLLPDLSGAVVISSADTWPIKVTPQRAQPHGQLLKEYIKMVSTLALRLNRDFKRNYMTTTESTKLRDLLNNLPDPDLCQDDGPTTQPEIGWMFNDELDYDVCCHYLRLELNTAKPNMGRVALWCQLLLRADY